MALHLMGYANVRNLAGGMTAWKAASLPVSGYTDWAAVMGEFISTIPEEAAFYTIKADKFNELLVESTPFILDVRETAEVEASGHITGSVNIPVRELFKNLDKLPALDQKIVVTCASGHRGALATMALRLLGYTDVVNLVGGTNGWVKAEFALEAGLPAAPVAGTAPEVDAGRLAVLDNYFSALPEGFYAVKNADFNTELVDGKVPFILDVRSEKEYADPGHIDGAVVIPLVDLPAHLDQLPADKATPIVVACASGHRAAFATLYLQFLGYTNVRNLNGGMNGWIAAELPVVK
jgi:rhodanese-related sulfurtransferase